MISNGFNRLSNHKLLIVFPIAYDLLALMYGLLFTGFYGESKVSIKLAIEVGLPSIATIIDQQVNVMANSLTFYPGMVEPSLQMLLLLAIGLLFTAFLQAGFIGLVNDLTLDKKLTFNNFINYGKKFWISYLVVELVWIAALVLSFLLIVIPLQLFGMLIFIILLFTFRILFIYWEFTIIVDDVSVFEGLRKSRVYFANRTDNLFPIIFAMLAFNIVIGLIVNAIWNPIILILFIFIYGYASSGFQVALMLSLYKVKNNNTEDPESNQ
ncbi:hypothetical protein CIB95_10890 [Lottiidibacillus patelloidae]|uniref:Glycerophosphoryl diester phosphodiesterase membrane domain-containing protein n=1 Tax=Lottiidibacillus patelloidae TaxID=2670334 RepID=A0A263BSQ1_9BACI|nr:hypothetical protein [Lottiidibacillus patelloidae]OZM56719.1 hypothetical protein CIB95_10890 [Lottiidibacillus patelloidae]